MKKEISFKSDGIRLYGSLTLPKTKAKKYPCAILLHGTFPQTRDGNIDAKRLYPLFSKKFPKRNLFCDIEKIILQAGIACFRYDKRGAGKSGGDGMTAGLTEFAQDAYAAIKKIRELKQIDENRIGFLGQSEGIMPAIMVATKYPKKVKFLILQGAHFGDYDELDEYEFKTMVPIYTSRENSENLMKLSPLYYYYFRDFMERRDALKKGKSFYTFTYPKFKYKLSLKRELDWIKKPAYKYVPKLKCKISVLQGELDLNVPKKEALQFKKAFTKYHIPNKIKVFKNLDHSFRNVKKHHNLSMDESSKLIIDPTYVDYFQKVVKWCVK